jgi:prolyl-tRNA editing enzyme YbaK/EbsC (Cys-tRNA(Pro) deacylase)
MKRCSKIFLSKIRHNKTGGTLMTNSLSPDAQRFQDGLRNRGYNFEVVEHAQTTHSAKEAARAIGCSLGQIAKSLVFRKSVSRSPLLVIASGPNRVNELSLGEKLGEPLEKANPDFVYAATGFSVGGVPPTCHTGTFETIIDKDLLKYELIWAAGGSPNAVFPLTPTELVEITTGKVLSIK